MIMQIGSNALLTIELKVTLLRSAADYSGKPLYPKPKELGFTGFFYKQFILTMRPVLRFTHHLSRL